MKSLLVKWANFCFNFFSTVEGMSVVVVVTVNGKSPQELYEFMLNLDREKYLDWHKDHKDFKIVKHDPQIIGSIFYFEEFIGKKKINYNWKIISLKQNEKMILKAEHFYDVTLELTFTKSNENTIVTHALRFGLGNHFLDFFVRKMFLTDTFRKNMQQHAEEEFKTLEHLIKNKY